MSVNGRQLDRAPVNATVTNVVPVRLAAFGGRYQVCNLSSSATVWLSNDSTAKDGVGTPLAPGASLVREVQGELWAALGADAQSVAAGRCTVVLDPMIEQWSNPVATALAILNSGVIVIDQQTTLVPAQLNNPAVTTLTNIDVSRYRSIYVRFLYVAGSGSITFTWFDSTGAIQLGQDAYSWVSGDNVNCSLHIPVVGSILQVAWNWSQTSGFNITVLSSYRDVPKTSQRVVDRDLGSASSSIASGATLSLTPAFRYDGPCTVRAAIGATVTANEGLELNIVNRVTGSSFAGQMQAVTQLVGHTFAIAFQEFVAPRASWRVDLVNRTSTTQTITGQLTASPEGT